MSNLHWKQSISKVEPDKVLVRGYRIDELMEKVPFASAVFLVLTGKLPDRRWDHLLEAILVSTVDHGVTAPSVLASINAASGGASMNASIAAGVLAIARHHGGAIEECMKMLYRAVERMNEKKESEADAAAFIVSEQMDQQARLAGYGHKLHSEDPRSVRLYELARDSGMELTYFSMAMAIQRAIEKNRGRRLPLNVLGAISSILCELGCPSSLGSVFFILSRIPGLAAHAYEETNRQRPMRTIHPTDNEYDGPPERALDPDR